jgi:hypothetical protein
MSLFKRTVSREIKRFNKVLNLFKTLDIKLKVFDVGLTAVLRTYDGPDEIVRDNVLSLKFYFFLVYLWIFSVFIYCTTSI